MKKGTKMSIESIRKRGPHTEQRKLNISIAKKGKKIKPFSEEHKKKIGLAHLGKKKAPFSKEARENMSKAHIGEKNHNWIKDRTKLKNIDKRNNSECVMWRRSCRLRDENKCKIQNKDCKGILEVHHILPWKDYPELRYDINNGITLCKHHHPRVRKDVERLSPYFTKLIKNQ